MTNTDTPDVIIVGAGAAGVCCAAEAVLQGLRPLLIAEGSEVGFQFRPMKMENAQPLRQSIGRSLYGDGGWWYSLLKRLDVPVKLHRIDIRPGTATVGSTTIKPVPSNMTAAQLAEGLAARASMPLGPGDLDTLTRVLLHALTMPRAELGELHDITMGEWVQKVGNNSAVTEVCRAYARTSSFMSPDEVERYLSVFGFFNRLRDYYFGEADMYMAEPDLRNGIFVPLANAVERHGGQVLRGRKVARLLTQDDRVVGVVLDDGTEFCAPAVAVAAGTSRLPALFDGPVPDEIRAVRDFEAEIGNYSEFMAMYVVDRKLFPADWDAVYLNRPDGTRLHVEFNATGLAPWSTPEGLEVIGSETLLPAAAVVEAGGPDALFRRMAETTETLIPGLAEATIERVGRSHPSFLTPSLIGPKLPRSSREWAGLWYVGEGSVPVEAMYGEGAACAGVLGARAIAAGLRAAVSLGNR